MAAAFQNLQTQPEARSLEHGEWLALLFPCRARSRSQPLPQARRLRLHPPASQLLLIGPAGIGKSWLACALGHQACREDLSVDTPRATPLCHAGSLQRHGRYGRLLKALAKPDLLILDNWGPEKISDDQRRDLLEIIKDRYACSSTVVTSQIPVDHWYDVIGNPTSPTPPSTASPTMPPLAWL
ncbi:ATP-binding protein [Bradyrhizobium sp. 137]|uniref:ATP-binding protein n=1 Tax=Bradyrhizobium sp. 137 TaxID=2782614 RepID=UPI001FF928D0|nr:ATP-binding protein [Bradyrhizobium sp. 137]